MISLKSFHVYFGHSYFAKEDEKPTVAKAEDEAIVGFADREVMMTHRPIAFHPRGRLQSLSWQLY